MIEKLQTINMGFIVIIYIFKKVLCMIIFGLSKVELTKVSFIENLSMFDSCATPTMQASLFPLAAIIPAHFVP